VFGFLHVKVIFALLLCEHWKLQVDGSLSTLLTIISSCMPGWWHEYLQADIQQTADGGRGLSLEQHNILCLLTLYLVFCWGLDRLYIQTKSWTYKQYSDR